MPDNDINVPSSTSPLAHPIATEDIGGNRFQRIKSNWGGAGVAVRTDNVDGQRFPVGGDQIGATTETAPGTDTALAGLNGRLQRIAQNITSSNSNLNAMLTGLGSTNETAPATDTASSGLNGRLQRIAQNITNSNSNLSAMLTGQGSTTETAPATDTASSGLNGRLQRIAQRLTSILTQLTTGIIVQPRETTVTASVAISGTTTPAIDTAGYRYFALIIPSTLDGTVISFTGCDTSGGTYQAIYDIYNNPVQMTVAASRSYDLPGELSAWRFIKIVCATTQTTTTTDFILVMRS